MPLRAAGGNAMQFECPSCGGSLRVPESEKTTTCPFCGSSVLVPFDHAGLGGAARGVAAKQAGEGQGVSRTKIAGCLVVIAALVMLVAGVAAVLFLTAVRNDPGMIAGSEPKAVGGALLRFGAPGTGAGCFTDPRHVAVDGQGRIYVAERGTGRVQVFDSSGRFLSQWVVGEQGGALMTSMDADANGRVFAVEAGRIVVRDGMSGDSIGALPGPPGFRDVFVAGDGRIVATLRSAGDELFRFSPSGGEELHVVRAVEGASGRPELSPMAATDGLGRIFVLGASASSVFMFDSSGGFTARFGSAGDGPGRLRAPSDIAVDGRGLVYVSDISGIQVFDQAGEYIGTMAAGSGGYVSGMDFDPSGNLVVVTGSCEVLVLPPFEEK